MNANVSDDRSTPADRTRPADGPDASRTDRRGYELEYVTDDPSPNHESWLFEWALGWFERDGIVALSLSREEREKSDERSVSIRIETRTETPSIGFDGYARLADLAKRVDELSVRYPVGRDG